MATRNTKGRRQRSGRQRRPVRGGHHPATVARIAAAGLALGLAVGLAAGTAPAQAASGHQDWGAAARFVGQINAERASHGRSRLTVSSRLSTVAAAWAASMARSNTLAHNPHLAGSVSGWKVLAENVGVGPSVSSLESAFTGSAEHRANMLDPAFSLLGVAVVDVGDKLWVVEDFEQPTHSTASSGRSTGAAAPPGRAGKSGPAGAALSSLERARLRQLGRLFAYRHELTRPTLTAHTARQRTATTTAT